jgi:hypothetical protein
MHVQVAMYLISDNSRADVKIANQNGKLPSQLMMAKAKQAGKIKDCEACIQMLTNMENSQSSVP